MKPIGRDLLATVLVAAIIGIYTVYVRHTTGWIVSSTRATTGVVLLLGAVACRLGQAEDVYRGNRGAAMAVWGVWSSLLGVTALAAAAVGVVAGSETALTVLFGATVLLWAAATLRHAYTADEPPVGRGPRGLDRADVTSRRIDQGVAQCRRGDGGLW